MSELSQARDKLARSRQAIVDHVHARERRHDPHEEEGTWIQDEFPRAQGAQESSMESWLGHITYAIRKWWQYHPAHLAVDLATPAFETFAERRPGRLLGIAALAGAAFMLARPWKLISLTTLLVALLKSSQLPGLLMSALSAANYRKDHEGPG